MSIHLLGPRAVLVGGLSPAQTLDSYTADVEAGKAVLSVSPRLRGAWPAFEGCGPSGESPPRGPRASPIPRYAPLAIRTPLGVMFGCFTR
jgi:hypothetical protein